MTAILDGLGKLLTAGPSVRAVSSPAMRYIQEMLGHERLDTTQVYTQVSIRALKAIHDATHPAAKLRRKDAQKAIISVLHVRPEAAGEELLETFAAEAVEEETGA